MEINEEMLIVMKEISSKMDDLHREMREVKVRVSELSK